MAKAIYCSVEICDRDAFMRGLCRAHYDRLKRTGDIRADVPLRQLPTRAERQDLAGRLAANFVIAENGCWEWHGEVSDSGYGQLSWQGRKSGNTRQAHRLMWEHVVGPIPTGDEWTLDHLCHTNDEFCPGGPECPHRRCVNPDHLEVVTRIENSLRGGGLEVAHRNAKARSRTRMHCPHGHEYTPENTTWSGGRRYCRQCRHERWAKRKDVENARLRARYAARREAGLDPLAARLAG